MEQALEWLRRRILSVALSVASFITLLSFIVPSWMDFILDLCMIGLIWAVGKLSRVKIRKVERSPIVIED